MALAPEELRKKLTGVISFPVTPFANDLSLDIEGLRKNLRVLLRQPLSAIVAPSGTGELFSLLNPVNHGRTPQEVQRVLPAAGFEIKELVEDVEIRVTCA